MDEENRCLRCGTPYEPDATVCLACGAPIGESQSPTQPVRAITFPTPAPLPETAAPVSASAESGAGAGLAAPVPIPVPVSVGGAVSPAAGSTARRKRQWPIVLLICLLVLAAAGGAAYVVRALTAGPPVARQSLYHDPQHHFSFQRPALWLVTANADGGVTISDTGGSSTVKIGAMIPTVPTDAKGYADQHAVQLGLAADSPRSFAGEQWEQRSGQVTGSDGAVRQYVLLVTVHHGQLYSIEFASPVASFDGNNTLVFQPLLASFTFDS